ncbi:hypothetical protein GGTG_02712 [Gaeumannomyces tritici R3-111a-1]|uniref:Uncharacterized protein n=1 Tax=Gaeumannomyces tritici (strain R3-111a-1) TaxID=644352 RepID=J3NN54_GAET3|nr:hypothetical protein GGTG_02712 [Gaeumannomyces tritici R3-111a-1]EJT77606.1 hypothetical protein GGTG_02712 [Gaeumannomyces tritici R3-111a-1]
MLPRLGYAGGGSTGTESKLKAKGAGAGGQLHGDVTPRRDWMPPVGTRGTGGGEASLPAAVKGTITTS